MTAAKGGLAALALAVLAVLALAAPGADAAPRRKHHEVALRVARVDALRRARAAHVAALEPSMPAAVVPLDGGGFREMAPTPVTPQQKQSGRPAAGGAEVPSVSPSESSSESSGMMEDLLGEDVDDGADNDGSGSGSVSSQAGEEDYMQGPPYRCKAGHGCPANMTMGVCCKGGEFCCEELCLDDELPVRCGTTQGQRQAAREAYAENLSQAHMDEELTKKAMEQELYKRRLQMDGKTEQAQKSRLTQREEAAKRDITAAEERTKAEIKATSEAKMKLIGNAKGEEAHKRGATPMRLDGSVRNFGGGFRNASFHRVGTMCVLTGRIRVSGTFDGDLARLPHECRPRARLVFNAHVYGEHTARIDVAVNGKVVMLAAPLQELEWVSFDGISFFVQGSPDLEMELLPGWYHRAGGDAAEGGVATVQAEADRQYQNGGYNTYAGVCALTGMVQVRGTDQMSDMPFVSQLPPACRPKHHSVFSVSNHGETHRLDVFGPTENGDPGGRLYWNGGKQSKGWLSLDGVMLLTDTPKAAAQELAAADGFREHGEPYNGLTATIVDDVLVVLSGLVTSTKSGSGLITVLPENTRPSHRLVFSVPLPGPAGNPGVTPVKTARVDVFDTGEVWWIQSPSDGTGQPDPTVQDSTFRPAGSVVALDQIRFVIP